MQTEGSSEPATALHILRMRHVDGHWAVEADSLRVSTTRDWKVECPTGQHIRYADSES
jgi:hypothetical protein